MSAKCWNSIKISKCSRIYIVNCYNSRVSRETIGGHRSDILHESISFVISLNDLFDRQLVYIKQKNKKKLVTRM